MRQARVVLLAMATMAVTGLTAAPASAQTIRISNEATGIGCPTFTTPGAGGVTDVDGGCLIHVTGQGPSEIRRHIFGVESHIAECSFEFHARVQNSEVVPPGSEAGGRALETQITGSSCNRQICKFEATGEAVQLWMAFGEEEAFEGNELVEVAFCLEPKGGGADELCQLEIPFNQTATNHRYELGHATELPGVGDNNFRCEFIAHWMTETGGTHDGQAEQAVEITHL